MADNLLIREYDLARHKLPRIGPPPQYSKPGYEGRFNILVAQDGGLGVCQYMDPDIKLWTRKASYVPGAKWELNRVINLGKLPTGTPFDDDSRVRVLGFAEGANVIFVNTVGGIFTVDLQSEKARCVCHKPGFSNLIPVVSFYIPVPRGEHQDPLLLGPNEEPGPNNAPDEETVKSTSITSKDDAGNSKTSGRNVEDAAPTSGKGDS